MGASAILIADDALVISRAGVREAAAIEPGTELLGIAGGTHAWASVQPRQRVEGRAAKRLTTRAGIATVAADVRVEGSAGPTPASDIDVGHRLELVHPGDLPAGPPATSSLGNQAVYATVLPVDNGCADALEVALDELVARAGFRVEKLLGGRWLAVLLSRTAEVEWDVESEIELAMALHAWVAEDGAATEARIRVGDRQSRELVLGSLIAGRTGYDARAVPAFAPCEVRVTPTTDAWPAYSTVTSSRACRADAVLLEVDASRWSVIADLLILRSVRA